MVRLTIARKIALAVIAVAIVSIGTMAWVTSANIRRGFLDYLNEMQAQDLEQIGVLMAQRYRTEGGFDWLRHNPSGMRMVLDKMKPGISADGVGARRRPRPDFGARPQPGEDGPPPEAGDGPPPDADGPPPPRRDGPPPRPDGARPPDGAAFAAVEGQAGYERPDGAPAAERRGAGPRPRPAAPPPQRARVPQAMRDPMGFAARLSVLDAAGNTIMGPPDYTGGITRPIMVDGIQVGTLRLRPLRSAGDESRSANVFLRQQVTAILWLSLALLVAATLVAVWLARHLLRPVAALRDVTGRIARGDLEARAPLLSRDELAELALHVNAMAAALEANEQQRRRMVADISHELRTPITVIRGEIEALMDGIRQASPAAFESLHAEVLHLNKLVDDLHQLTLADANALAFHWRAVDLRDVLDPVLERYRLRAAGAGLNLRTSLPEHPLPVHADADRLTQVLVNLLENCVRYTDSGGQISVAATRSGARALVTVEDSAPGVPPDALARLFDRLYRVDSARTRERGGSGLGLAICKAFIEAHGGSIEAAPSPLGGLRMTIQLPLKED